MDVYSLTKKQRPTQLTRGQVDPNTSAMAQQPTEPHSQLPPEYRQAVLEQKQKQLLQQQQAQLQHQAAVAPAPPTLEEIGSTHSQLPPEYRQAVLEKKQREHQQRLLQQQQNQLAVPSTDSTRRQSSSLSSSPTGGNSANARRNQSAHQRIASAPMLSSHRSDRAESNAVSGPSRAHWKPDSSAPVCTWPGCLREFGFFDRRHHCRKCGDIFCTAHCSKSVPLDNALDFNPAMGVSSRACTGCFEDYEQWQGLVPSTSYSSQHSRGAFGSVSETHIAGDFTSDVSRTSGLLQGGRKNTGHIPEGLLGQTTGSSSSNETLGREDIVRLPKSATDNIAIKTRPSADPTVMPMPSVPHDWSWSTF